MPESNVSKSTPTEPNIVEPSARIRASGHNFFMQYPRSTLYWRLLSRLTMFGVGAIAKAFVRAWHKTEVHNETLFLDVLRQAKREKRGIVTVMNHVSVLDDPIVWGATLPLSVLGRPDLMRWTLAAKDICFRNKAESLFFSLGQVLSVERFGRGPDQPALDAAVQMLSDGKWIHLYPEGFVHQPYDPFEGTLRYFHWGVSRLVLESGPKPPIVMPIYGKGLQTVFPEDKQKRALGYGSTGPITYVFGKPIDDAKLDAFRSQWKQLEASANGKITPEIKQLRSAVANLVRDATVGTKRTLAELLASDTDPRLADPTFWKTQTLVKLKGKSMAEKRQRSPV